jgi:hypothetical protein
MVRACIVLLGLSSIAWGSIVLPPFWQRASLNDVATEYVQGRTLAMGALLLKAQQVRITKLPYFCDPATLHDSVLLHLAILEEAVTQGNQPLVNSAGAPLYEAIRSSVSCAPADSFVWLVLFWLDARKQGVRPNNVEFLRLSYALGRNEGWIDLWRNQLAMRLLQNLPDDVAADALGEFVRLVDTERLYQQTAAIFAAATPLVQSRIVAQLKTSKAAARRMFANALYDSGVDVKILHAISPAWQASDKRRFDVQLPDVVLPDSKP